MVPIAPPRRCLAAVLTEYPSSAAAASTASRVADDTRPPPLSASDAVVFPTPARRATSINLARRGSCMRPSLATRSKP